MGYLKKLFIAYSLGERASRPLYFFGGAGVSPALLVGGESRDGLVGGGVEDDRFAVDELYGYDLAY